LIFFRKLIENINDDENARSDSDAISTLSSTYIGLGIKLGLKSTRRCGICVERINGVQFDELKLYIENFLDATKETAFDLSYSIHVDNNHGYFWIIIDANRIEDSVACIIAVGETIEQKGFPQQLMSAVFEFSKDGTEYQPYYLIYNYKLDKFYPFVPIMNRRNARNNQEEIKIMKAIVDDKLPFEENIKEWRPIWYLPF
jgi:hypothetical protein